ncbi:MAG: FkbM family methyltransferase [Solirubrobacteraceae bacterium]
MPEEADHLEHAPLGARALGDVPRPAGPDAVRVARVQDHSFLAAPIRPGSTVIDLGMNTGQFATTMISVFGCSVVGVEPAAALFDQIPKIPGLSAEQAAITAHGESAEFFLSADPLAGTTDKRLSAPNAQTIEVAGTTLAEILERHSVERTPLVKVDIEGAEIPMLDEASEETLQRVDQFTIEFHDFFDPAQAGDVQRVKKRLRSAGFAEMTFSPKNMDVLFVNRSRVPFTGVHRCAIAVLYKYRRGVTRNVRRRMLDWRGHEARGQ